MKKMLMGLVISLLATAVLAADYDEVKIEVTHVANNIYMLVGARSTIGVSVGEDGILMVDDQFAPLAGKIEEALRGIHKGELKFVLNTHFHGDHVGGNAFFGSKATIISHDNVRKRLLADKENGVLKESWPVITYEHGVTIHFNNESIEVIHKQGHTDGDSIVWFKSSNVLHMGDLFFKDRFPFVDVDGGVM